MLGNYEAGTAIVDSHQIVAAAARVIVDIAIEQDDRNLGLVKDPGDALVDLVLSFCQLHWSEEYARNTALEVILTKLFCLLLLRGTRRGSGSPEQVMMTSDAGDRDAAADGFKDLRR